MTDLPIYLIYLLAGIAAGVVSGLFGLGGGMTIVPALAVALPLQGVTSTHVMHLAIGTSLSVVLFTALYTTFLRHRRGDLHWPLFRRLAPAVIAGTAIGAFAGGLLPGIALRWIFICFVGYTIANALYRRHRKSTSSEASGETDPEPVPALPTHVQWSGPGLLTGVTGAILGGGAAVIAVPYLQAAGYRMRQASAVAAALSAVIGIGAGTGYLLAGIGAIGLPVAAIGYLYLPAFAGMTVGALLGAPLGIWISHRMPENAQFLLFLTYLAAVLTAMAWPR